MRLTVCTETAGRMTSKLWRRGDKSTKKTGLEKAGLWVKPVSYGIRTYSAVAGFG